MKSSINTFVIVDFILLGVSHLKFYNYDLFGWNPRQIIIFLTFQYFQRFTNTTVKQFYSILTTKRLAGSCELVQKVIALLLNVKLISFAHNCFTGSKTIYYKICWRMDNLPFSTHIKYNLNCLHVTLEIVSNFCMMGL